LYEAKEENLPVTDIDQLQGKLNASSGIQFSGEYVRTAVLILLVRIDGEYHFVFQKRASNIRQNGEICFPGGVFHEGDGNPERTAVRETVEEMGIPADKIRVIGAADSQLAAIGAEVHAFVGVAEIRGLSEITPNKDEVEHIFSVPVSHFEQCEPQIYRPILKVHPSVVDEKTGVETILFPAAALGLPDRYAKPWGGLRHTIYVYRVEQGIIWGITARFIVDVIKKLKS
jgi:coenzyme A diphosphatase NUDT7